MKDLTTFILGLLFLLFGIIELYIFKENFGFNWSLLNGLFGILFLWIGIGKLDKSTN